jgi:hypothetical protein
VPLHRQEAVPEPPSTEKANPSRFHAPDSSEHSFAGSVASSHLRRLSRYRPP